MGKYRSVCLDNRSFVVKAIGFIVTTVGEMLYKFSILLNPFPLSFANKERFKKGGKKKEKKNTIDRFRKLLDSIEYSRENLTYDRYRAKDTEGAKTRTIHSRMNLVQTTAWMVIVRMIQ